MRRAFIIALALSAPSCRASGPYPVEIELTPSGRTLNHAGEPYVVPSGFECVDAEDPSVRLYTRGSPALELRLEVLELPDDLGSRRLGGVAAAECQAGRCPVHCAARRVLECGADTAGTCLLRVFSDAEGDPSLVFEDVHIDVDGIALIRLVAEGDDGPIGCAYSLPLRLGAGPVEADLAIDADACTSADVDRCAITGSPRLPCP